MTKEEWIKKKNLLKLEKEKYNKEIYDIIKTLNPLNYMFKSWHGSKNHFVDELEAKKYFDKYCDIEKVKIRMKHHAERIYKERKLKPRLNYDSNKKR